MTVSYVSSATAEATSITLPTHQAGDLIILCVARLSSVFPTVVSGWNVSQARSNGTSPTRAMYLAWKIAKSSNELSGTWTNANLILAAVYRDSADYVAIAGFNSNGGSATTTVNYPAVATYTNANSFTKLQSDSEFLLGVVFTAENTGVGCAAPSGMTNRNGFAGATNGYLALHDTNSTVASWANTNVVAASNVNYVTILSSIIDTGISKSGGAKPVNPFNQQVIG